MPRKPKCWCFTTGEQGSTVTVYERTPGGLLYARTLDRALANGGGGYRRLSLGHKDRERATTYALDQAAKLRHGRAELLAGKATLARLFAQYLANRTPRKTPYEQDADRRRAEMWARVLGAQKDAHLINLGEWERFVGARSSGAIDALGKPVPEEERRPVRARQPGRTLGRNGEAVTLQQLVAREKALEHEPVIRRGLLEVHAVGGRLPEDLLLDDLAASREPALRALRATEEGR